jgi:hypothetical protein
MPRKTRKHRKEKEYRGDSNTIIIDWIKTAGLGNIFFMYAIALLIKEKTGLSIIAGPTLSKHSKTDYRFLFKECRSINSETIKQRIKEGYIIFPEYKLFTKELININTIPKEINKDIIVSNYFQQVKPIEHLLPEIRKHCSKELSKRYTFTSDKTSAFLQIRRGDYLKYNLTSPRSYYTKAISLFNDNPNINSLYIITTDPVWFYEQKFDIKKKIFMVDSPDELYALYVMMNCKAGAIVSTSTFGIWGALLGPYQNPSSTIIIDNTHGKRAKNYKDALFLPERWIAI